MAGGQERILRRRIRSIQSTKKITRAMELIAASRIVKAHGAVAGGAPYSDQITEVVARPRRRRRWASDSPLLVPRPEIRKVAHIVIAADRGLCGAYNSSVIRAAEGADVAEQARRAATTRSSRAAARPRATSATATTASTRRSPASRDQPTYEDARQIGARGRRARSWPARSTRSQLVYTRFVSAGVQEVVRRPLDAARRARRRSPAGRRGDDGDRRRGYEFEPSPDEHPRPAAAALRRVAASTPRCSTPPRRSTPPASGR